MKELIVLPLWAATWELECCYPEASVGERWEAPVTLRPETDPWWVSDHATEEQRTMGLVTLEPDLIHRDNGGCMVEWNSLRFRIEEPPRSSPITGRLYLDAHAEFGDIDPAEVTIQGVVERMEMIPIRHREWEERFFVPAEQLPAIDVTSTLERDRLQTRGGSEGWIMPELLIWLKIG